ncbi:GlsB/YeaQ/YmgE family stress response membrane protein [Nucisporomicrobium flavum]|uniref:GlsB/YeaQ/YmgE family stress response membrane protein n=1 Tax=Nucisporomicrobium flavum TaxID=2785915 RepID=UPI0018F2F839|nr:GlsB/YeaQ/YmgE family stress response membrane protein [Nucisporomicrobium flavum]
MSFTSLITAAAVGIAVGFAVGISVSVRRGLPLWLPPAIGAAAAVCGTVAAWLAGAPVGSLPLDLSMQFFFAATGVAVMLARTQRRPDPGR